MPTTAFTCGGFSPVTVPWAFRPGLLHPVHRLMGIQPVLHDHETHIHVAEIEHLLVLPGKAIEPGHVPRLIRKSRGGGRPPARALALEGRLSQQQWRRSCSHQGAQEASSFEHSDSPHWVSLTSSGRNLL